MGDTLDTQSFGCVAKTFLDILGSRNTSGSLRGRRKKGRGRGEGEREKGRERLL